MANGQWLREMWACLLVCAVTSTTAVGVNVPGSNNRLIRPDGAVPQQSAWASKPATSPELSRLPPVSSQLSDAARPPASSSMPAPVPPQNQPASPMPRPTTNPSQGGQEMPALSWMGNAGEALVARERVTVGGRLSDRGRPVTNCRVAIVPMELGSSGYRAKAGSRPLLAVTDQRGEYQFEQVPEGKYKITWLPDGTNQWIRRISLQPDVNVRGGGNVRLKEIRVALHTVN